MSAAGVMVSTAPIQGAGPGSSPRVALQDIRVKPIPFSVAREIVKREHYLHSMPGGTCLAFGSFIGQRLLGVATFGSGPMLAHSLVDGASPKECMTLTRLWLSDEIPTNGESRFLGVVIRAIKKNTSVKFLVSYADPAQGHLGIIYQATNWLYTGLSSAMPLYDLGDGKPRHSRSLSHAFGTHSVRHFKKHGADIVLISQAAKYRYIYLLDKESRGRLKVAVLPYPKQEASYADN